MSTQRCCECGFNIVGRNRGQCPECGERWPRLAPSSDTVRSVNALTGIAGGLLCYLYLEANGIGLPAATWGLVPLVMVFAVVVGYTSRLPGCLSLPLGLGLGLALTVGLFIAKPLACIALGFFIGFFLVPWALGAIKRRLASPTNLRTREAEIRARLNKLDESLTAIARLEQRITQMEATPTLTQTLMKLRNSVEVIERQKSRHRVLLWEIQLIRWQNRIEPIVAGLTGLTFCEGDDAMRTVAEATGAGSKMLAAWQSDTAAAATADGRSCIERLQQALTAAEPLREAIVAQQARATLQEVTPMTTPGLTLGAGIPPTCLNQDDALDALNRALQEVDGEFYRLKIEDEIARQNEALPQ